MSHSRLKATARLKSLARFKGTARLKKPARFKGTARALSTLGAVGAVGIGSIMTSRAMKAGQSPKEPGAANALHGEAYAERAANNLGELIRFRTVFNLDAALLELEEFDGFIEALARLYPLTHAELGCERVNGHGLLFRWKGSRPNASTKAVVLMAHYDVVPVDERDDWTFPGFSGRIQDGYVWGRGALDDKGALVTIMEAIESLLAEGFVPDFDIYLSFGNNEEPAGDSALEAVRILESRGIKPWLVLDEGGAVALDTFPGLDGPAAMIGVAEKGILDVQLLSRSPGGHASTPPRMGATARLAQAIMAIEKKPFASILPAPVVAMTERLGSKLGLAPRLVTANMWAFKPLVTVLFGLAGEETRAMTRTTVAITMLQGSKASNVLASTATANANIRIAIGQTVESTVAELARIINDPLVEISVIDGHGPSPVSASDNEQFALLGRCVAASYPEALVTPYVQTGATDSRHFTQISAAVYRFSPLLMDREDRGTLHAVNERVRVSSLGAGVVFYRELMRGLKG